jgi:EAL domain-containing protein (putative c-di-GMP-specific phosphodiesterase class I)
MYISLKAERTRRFSLALRMGIPILLLISVLVYYLFSANQIEFNAFDLSAALLIVAVSIYFLFFLINLGQNETLIDPMTGVFNRNALLQILEKKIQNHEIQTLVLMRLENLSAVNDHYGIDRGDRILKIFSKLFENHLEMEGLKEPIAGRYHGSDFIIAFPFPFDRTIEICDAFTTAYPEIDGIAIEYRFTAVETSGRKPLERLINHLYDTITQQKKPSEHSVQTFSPNLQTLEKEIVEAVRQAALKLYFVPAYHLQKGQIDLFEVNVKLQTATNDILPPKRFIPVVNRLGLEQIFDRALFQAVCDTAATIDPAIRFSFNLSPFSLRREGFSEMIVEIAKKRGVDPHRIVIELFENRPFKDVKRYRMILEELREEGFGFALDNFGGSNASVEYIKKLPVSMVHFDKEFTTMNRNPKIEALLGGYLQMCQALQIETLVKWVDDEKVKEYYKAMGIDYIQGFIVAKTPLDTETLQSQYGDKI